MKALGIIKKLTVLEKGGLIVALFLFLAVGRYLYRRFYEIRNKHQTFLKGGYGEDYIFKSKRGNQFEAVKLKRQLFDGAYLRDGSGYLLKVVNQKQTVNKLLKDVDFLSETLGQRVIDVSLKRNLFSERKMFILSFDSFKSKYLIRNEKMDNVFMYDNSSKPVLVNLNDIPVVGIFTQTGGGKTASALTLIFIFLRDLIRKYPKSKPKLLIGSKKLNDYPHLRKYKDKFDCSLYSYNNLDQLKELNDELQKIMDLNDTISSKLEVTSFRDRDHLERSKKKHKDLQKIEIPSIVICLDEMGGFSKLKPPPRIDMKTSDDEAKRTYKRVLLHYNEKVRFARLVEDLADTIRYLGIKMIYMNQHALVEKNVLHHSEIPLRFFSRVSKDFSENIFSSNIASSHHLRQGKFVTQIDGDEKNYRLIKFGFVDDLDFSNL